MQKPAVHDYPLNTLLEKRWSPRAFAHTPVETWKICALMEAARWSPSSYNEQPWRFIVGASQVNLDVLETLQSVLMDANSWAKQAPVLILAVAKNTFSHNNTPNRHAPYDTGAAAMSMVVQATELGLVCHQMAGFDGERACHLFSIPQDFTPMAMLAFGYEDTPESLTSDELKQRERAARSRKPLQETTFSGQWEQPYPACFN